MKKIMLLTVLLCLVVFALPAHAGPKPKDVNANVVNDEFSPVPVTIVDGGQNNESFPREPWRTRTFLTVSENNASSVVPLPPDKIVVIEQISVFALIVGPANDENFVPNELPTLFQIETGGVYYGIPFPREGIEATATNDGLLTIYGIDRQVRLYANSELIVSAQKGLKPGNPGPREDWTVNIALHGYSVPATSPNLGP